ncbi:MAG: DUF6788 family protein [Egibacteraceae bacterium]
MGSRYRARVRPSLSLTVLSTVRQEDRVDTHPKLDNLEQRRTRLYDQLVASGDLRRGSVTESYRRCGKPNCACAGEKHPGHGPRWMWTRKDDGKTTGRQLKPDEVDKVRGEIAAYRRFVRLSREVVEVNEAICEARPLQPPGDNDAAEPTPAEAEKGGWSTS